VAWRLQGRRPVFRTRTRRRQAAGYANSRADARQQRQRRVAACVIGTVIAVADGRYADADLLVDGLTPDGLAVYRQRA
jgi:hypothetical protein